MATTTDDEIDNHDHGTEDVEETSKAETDARVREAFEEAAKELGIEIKFEGSYIFLPQECDAETKDKLKTQANECSAVDAPSTPIPDTKDEHQTEDPKDRPLVGDTIPGTRYKYGEIVKSTTCPGNKQTHLDSMPKTHLDNAVKAFQALEAFQKSSGVTGTITSAYRCGNIGNSKSNHMKGHAIDLQPSGSAKNAFIKVMEGIKAGTVKGHQFIYEIKPGQREAGAIIHFDFSPGSSQALVGGQGVGSPYISAGKDSVSLEKAITERLARF